MNEMVERVAGALHEKLHPSETPWDAVPESWRESYRKQARAAIEAMREPTEAMLDHPSYIHGEWSRRNIEAYFDAALKDGPS